MPHILFKGQCDFESVKNNFTKCTKMADDSWIVKYNTIYLSADGKQALIETASIRSGFIQTYYVMIEQKQEKVTIRVCPLTNVEKTFGVKRSIVYVANYVFEQCPDLVFDKSNLEKELLPEYKRDGNDR